MDKDEIKGKAQKAKGFAKEKIGQAANDPDLEAEGTVDRGAGEIREGFGEAKDKAKRAIDELKD
jgi:uncharacterized protein YjbJ (UPF0337 family)